MILFPVPGFPVPCLKVAVQQRVGRGRRHHIHDGHDVTDGRGGVCQIQHISDDASLPEDERQGQEQGCHWAAGDHVPRQSGQAEGVQFKGNGENGTLCLL